jgi:predicted Zn-dependent protease
MSRPSRPGTAALVLVTLLAGCAPATVPPIGSGGQAFTPEADERALWAAADREARDLVNRTSVYQDPALQAYLTAIAGRLLPESARAEGAPAIVFTVLRDATLNAFAMPDGHVFVHTGLLARLENEAQLAAVLGHEIAHVTHRHAFRFDREARDKRFLRTMAKLTQNLGIAGAATVQDGGHTYVGAPVLSQTANAIVGLKLKLASAAAIDGYGRDLEREADREGMRCLVEAGYDAGEAPNAFRVLQSGLAGRGAAEIFYLGSSARLQERIEDTAKLLETTFATAAAAAGGVRSTAEFERRMRPVVRDNADEDIRLGRFALARAQLDAVLSVTPDDPAAQLYYGELLRLQAQRATSPADRSALAGQAQQRYARALELDPAFADPYRQLGLLYYQQHDGARAREAFAKYLTLRPDAPDAPRIRDYLGELGR